MIRALIFCARTPGDEQGRTWEAVACLLEMQLLFSLLPFRWALRFLRQRIGTSGSGEMNSSIVKDVSRAIHRAARHVPFRTACLHQAFAAGVMLRRRNLPATVHLGLARDLSPSGLKAHAWCYCGEVAVVGVENASDFTSVASFAG